MVPDMSSVARAWEDEEILRRRFVPDPSGKIALDPERSIARMFVIKFVEGSHVRSGHGGLLVDTKAIVAHASEQERLRRSLG